MGGSHLRVVAAGPMAQVQAEAPLVLNAVGESESEWAGNPAKQTETRPRSRPASVSLCQQIHPRCFIEGTSKEDGSGCHNSFSHRARMAGRDGCGETQE